mgnify:CR=1 FL=1
MPEVKNYYFNLNVEEILDEYHKYLKKYTVNLNAKIQKIMASAFPSLLIAIAILFSV